MCQPPLGWIGILTEDAIRNLAQQDVPTFLRMGILTEEEIRNSAFHIQHSRCENQAMERDVMHVQGAVHVVMHARRQNQEAMHKIATDAGRRLQLLSQPQVRQHKHFKHLKGFLPRCQRLHKEAAENMERLLLNVSNNGMPGAEEAMDSKELQMPVQVQPRVTSQSSRRKQRNRRRPAGKDTNAEAAPS